MFAQNVLQKVIEKQYLKGLSQKVGREPVEQIQQLYQEIVGTNRHWAVDRPSAFNLAISSLVLASYKVLKNMLPGEEWRSVIQYALIERTQERQRFFMRLYLRMDPNPFPRIVKISKTKQIKHYGNKQFTHESVVDTENKYVLRVHKCFYYNFFREHDAGEVTAIFCGLDNIWGELLNPGNAYGVIFERTAMLSTGQPACSFEFTRLK